MATKIFLLRHADYNNNSLSDLGVAQAFKLGNKLKKTLGKDSASVVIWTSSAVRARETALIIKKIIGAEEIIVKEKLWSDSTHYEDFNWLKKELQQFTGKNLIIISHPEYVQFFPKKIGFPINNADYASGVVIEGESYEPFTNS